jgi:hypothetical protein
MGARPRAIRWTVVGRRAVDRLVMAAPPRRRGRLRPWAAGGPAQRAIPSNATPGTGQAVRPGPVRLAWNVEVPNRGHQLRAAEERTFRRGHHPTARPNSFSPVMFLCARPRDQGPVDLSSGRRPIVAVLLRTCRCATHCAAMGLRRAPGPWSPIRRSCARHRRHRHRQGAPLGSQRTHPRSCMHRAARGRHPTSRACPGSDVVDCLPGGTWTAPYPPLHRRRPGWSEVRAVALAVA